MALIQCIECGTEYSDIANACPKCACPTSAQVPNSSQSIIQKKSLYSRHCPKCNGQNIEYTFIEMEHRSKGYAEKRKKSIVTRTGNKAGRTGMIMLTGGLWALTPKKSKYNEKQKGKTTISNQKMAICQDCGNSWKVK
ncbi:MAG: hypothetical protein HFG29_01355 [Eubacterium sp.]|nr:hypothetical protein [Eubacterium sp.]